jgi:CRP-like cAMP-binding protein
MNINIYLHFCLFKFFCSDRDERTLTQVSKLREPNAASQRRTKVPTPTDIGVRQQVNNFQLSMSHTHTQMITHVTKVPTTRIALHQHDHRLLRVGAELIRLAKSETVVDQRKAYQRQSLYVVRRGAVRLEAGGAIANGARWAVAERRRDQFFGYTGFLGVAVGGEPWVRAVAAESKTEVCIVLLCCV